MPDTSRQFAVLDALDGARCLIARCIVRVAIWLLPDCKVRWDLTAFADNWRDAVDRPAPPAKENHDA